MALTRNEEERASLPGVDVGGTVPRTLAWPQGVLVHDEPVRRVHTRGRRRNTALVYSTLPLGMRVAESQAEVRFLKVAQLDPRAALVRAQPAWLRVWEETKIRRRAPDFAVLIDGRAELHEVKQDAECLKAEVASELLAVRDEVERHPGWYYSVTLQSALVREPLCSNTDLLWREFGPPDEIDIEVRLRTLAALDDRPLTAAELIEQVGRSSKRSCDLLSWPDILAMIAARLIHFDVDTPLTMESSLWTEHSGPARKRTLPFGSVGDAITPPKQHELFEPFCSLAIRRGPR